MSKIYAGNHYKDISFRDIEDGDALTYLLRPIKWSHPSSVRSRMDLVNERHESVHIAYPFMNLLEKGLADKWMVAEAHEGLWD